MASSSAARMVRNVVAISNSIGVDPALSGGMRRGPPGTPHGSSPYRWADSSDSEIPSRVTTVTGRKSCGLTKWVGRMVR